MKHYNSPVINLIYYRQTDVIRTSDQNGSVDSVSLNDTDVNWGGNW